MERDLTFENSSPGRNQTIYKQMNDIKRAIEQDEKISKMKKRRNSILTFFVLLIGIGLINFYSSILRFDNITIHSKLIKHGVSLILSFCTFIATCKFDYRKYSSGFARALFAVVGGLIFLIVAIGPSTYFPTINGGKGWIRFAGIGFQVTEIFKIFFIMIIASILARGKDGGEKIPYYKNFISVLFYVAVFFLLLGFPLKDLGTGIHYVMITAFLIFMSDIPNKLLTWISEGTIAGILISLVSAYNFPAIYSFLDGYKQHRVKIYLDGIFKNTYDRMDAFQIYQSLVAFGTGGLLGKGYGNGVQKYNYIPEVETDFAIATFAEEMGFIGMFLVLASFFILFVLIMNVAETSKDYFAKYLIAGIAGYFITQVIINIGVAIGLIPVFGIPLPFISSGGSSLLTLSIAMGIVLNVNKANIKEARKIKR